MLRIIKCIAVFFILIEISTPANASHLLGGYFNYEPSSINDSSFQVSLVLIRDALSNGSPHDDFINIQIYNRTDINDFEYIETINIPLAFESEKINSDFTINVEYGHYLFNYRILDFSKDYYFVYQRCCLADPINNLLIDEETGVSIICEIKKEAIGLKNSSATFTEKLDFVASTNTFNEIPLTLFDNDGDSISVEFTKLKKGGGTAGIFGPSSDPPETVCEGIRPEGPCLPPYKDILYLDENVPIIGWDSLQIGHNALVGIPKQVGYSVYAFTVKEFRDNQLINQIDVIYPMFTVFGTSTQVNEKFQSNTRLFPNPSDGSLSIVSNQNIEKVEIYDLNGKKFKKIDVGNKEAKLFLEIPQGMYLTKIFYKDHSEVKKWFVR